LWELSAKRSHSFALIRYSSRSLIDYYPIVKPLGPELGPFYFLDELGEAIRNRRRTNFVVLPEPPPDFGADLLLFP
jgi:hypothetical protein